MPMLILNSTLCEVSDVPFLIGKTSRCSHHCDERISQPKHYVTVSSCFQMHREEAPSCTVEDLWRATDNDVAEAEFWADKIYGCSPVDATKKKWGR
ncbi:unnamed protein product [Arctia plantaginis]|uniref:Uncharacterized protein n=1 Tax=Arctia plantaginis TaxID=874455 RepID=A0A8S1BLK5_ARCPL|nr:unnamed protein product [Arctia plantaginis]